MAEEEKKEESKFDVEKAIKDLGALNWSGSNAEQGKAVALFKGLAFSDDPKANQFMKAVDTATTSIAKSVLKESVDTLLDKAETSMWM